ncbi:hypothetical protein ACE1CD_24200 [Aerosakkonema sp. BLCC-F183]|uniref:hypothetical protein n=1 Tax=Aerosakkonema sp. BLCC-F183 TaxID=3342834 RepID=UPI0035B8E0F8
MSLFAADYQHIQLACDTELFINPQQALRLIEAVVEAGSNVSFITKMALSDHLVDRISQISHTARNKGIIVSCSVSFTSTHSATEYEPTAPAPDRRIDTLKKLYRAGVHTRVAIRPLIPTVNLWELEELVDRTIPYTYSYYSGPLWLPKLDPNFVAPGTVIRHRQVSWMPGNPRWYHLEHPQKQRSLAEHIERSGSYLYSSSIEAIAYTREQYFTRVA